MSVLLGRRARFARAFRVRILRAAVTWGNYVSLYLIFRKTEHVNAAVGEQLERFFHLCNIQTAGYVVPVGSMLLVDAMHPVVWGALGEHLWVQGDGGQYTEKASRFAASDKATAYAPALEAMFLYELPRNALLVGGDRQHGAYVGVRQYSKEHRVTHVLYMCLPMRALIANEMFALLEMNPAMCRVVSDSVI